MSDLKIAGCHECLLCDTEWTTCRHPDRAGAKDTPQEEAELMDAWRGHDADGKEVLRAPSWCPLRQGALTLQLRTAGKSKVTR